jgi:N-acyl-D-amino-acid deacylase
MYTRFRDSMVVAAAAMLVAACGSTPRSSSEAPSPAADGAYDVIIVNGRVVDGSGNAWFYGDVALRGDKIVRVVRRGQLGNAQATKKIDATGMVVAPGFIDIQGQSGDLFLRGDGRDVGKLTQGVTTEILGEAYTGAP